MRRGVGRWWCGGAKTLGGGNDTCALVGRRARSACTKKYGKGGKNRQVLRSYGFGPFPGQATGVCSRISGTPVGSNSAVKETLRFLFSLRTKSGCDIVRNSGIRLLKSNNKSFKGTNNFYRLKQPHHQNNKESKAKDISNFYRYKQPQLFLA